MSLYVLPSAISVVFLNLTFSTPSQINMLDFSFPRFLSAPKCCKDLYVVWLLSGHVCYVCIELMRAVTHLYKDIACVAASVCVYVMEICK